MKNQTIFYYTKASGETFNHKSGNQIFTWEEFQPLTTSKLFKK